MNQFERLEELAQHLIEEPFQHFFPAHVRLADLAEHLLVAIEKNRQLENGATASHYRIMVNPVDYADLVAASGREAFETELYAYLTGLTADLIEPLYVVLVKNDTVGPGQVVIKADDMV
jgi:hypothetical protein